ncbi:hypothetical protein [Streptomyces somaliensis]|uniref:hypothetical protein n=1 Tax=Streptomyces somaliensis TaxID=78355 RepID=UPI0034E98057|nr:hypothetical protein [Streptomyces somaliensis]
MFRSQSVGCRRAGRGRAARPGRRRCGATRRRGSRDELGPPGGADAHVVVEEDGPRLGHLAQSGVAGGGGPRPPLEQDGAGGERAQRSSDRLSGASPGGGSGPVVDDDDPARFGAPAGGEAPRQSARQGRPTVGTTTAYGVGG